MNFVYKTIPRHTEEDVLLDQKIKVFFMVDLNKNALKEEHIILFNMTEQKVEPVEFEYNRRILTIAPLRNLAPRSHYQLQIVGGKNGIKDITGRTMYETYEVEFFTKDIKSVKPPRILSPTDVSVVKGPVEIQIEPVEDADHYEIQISTSNTFHNVVWPKDGEIVYHTPEIKVIPDVEYENRNYYVRARTVDHTFKKSAWSPVIQFYVENQEEIIEPEEPEIPSEQTEEKKVVLATNSRLHKNASQLDALQNVFSLQESNRHTRLYVKKTSVKDQSVHNSLERLNQIVIEFSDEIDPDSVNEETCYLLVERN